MKKIRCIRYLSCILILILAGSSVFLSASSNEPSSKEILEPDIVSNTEVFETEEPEAIEKKEPYPFIVKEGYTLIVAEDYALQFPNERMSCVSATPNPDGRITDVYFLNENEGEYNHMIGQVYSCAAAAFGHLNHSEFISEEKAYFYLRDNVQVIVPKVYLERDYPAASGITDHYIEVHYGFFPDDSQGASYDYFKEEPYDESMVYDLNFDLRYFTEEEAHTIAETFALGHFEKNER